MARSETTTRVLVALVAIPIGVVLVVAGGWALALLLGAIAVAGALEFYRLAEQKGIQPLRFLGGLIAALFVALGAVNPVGGPEAAGYTLLLLFSVVGVAVVAIWARGVERDPLLAFSTTLTGAVYTGYLLSFALFLRHLPGSSGVWHGTALLFAPVLLTWASDTAAYFVGRQWGARKLFPSVSPGKTVEGAIGAVAGAVLVAIAYRHVLLLFPLYHLELWQAVVLGILVSIAAQVGDLVESLFKRDAGVKDSGALLPGHGGALDRFDSLFFTLPLGYYFFRLVFSAQQAF
ncbi:MAG: phosphatidate cytidylyltransferase [Gemmatimonas sp.]|nr:phosphatidate cytidylyltransferase [Gemmatimonas sp.]